MGWLVLPRRSAIASFAPAIVDQYRHPNGTIMTVRRRRWWRRDTQGATWAAANGYAALGSAKLSLWSEQGFRSA